MPGIHLCGDATTVVPGVLAPQEGKHSLLSPAYMTMPRVNCLTLDTHLIWCAFSLALAKAGSSMAARMAMMAMTTKSSIKVKARHTTFLLFLLIIFFAFNRLAHFSFAICPEILPLVAIHISATLFVVKSSVARQRFL
jgi:hypothetical protein